MQPSTSGDDGPRLSPIGGSFQPSPKKEYVNHYHGTFSRAARSSPSPRPTQPGSAGQDFHSQHEGFEWKHGSVSKKGYTSGFISRAPRLGSSFRYTGPGPGSYHAPGWGNKFHYSATSCTISGPPSAQAVLLASIKQNRRVLQRLHGPDVPPPGLYTTNRTAKGAALDWKAVSGHKSAFVTTARPALVESAGQPAPGAYETGKQWGQHESQHSNFKLQPGHSRAGHIAKHGALPAVLTADTPPHAPALPPWCSLEVTPGPGAYELQKQGSETELVPVQRAAFGATGDGKGPGLIGKPEAPGPGAYEPITGNGLATKVALKSTGPSSSFRSKAERSTMMGPKAMLGKPPGPAFYSPHLPIGHRSFHFGAVLDSFVPAGATVCDLDALKQRAPIRQ